MLVQGLVLARKCPPNLFPVEGTNMCWPKPGDSTPDGDAFWVLDAPLAGAGVAAILFFLWGYALCLAVATKLEQRPQQGDAPSPQG